MFNTPNEWPEDPHHLFEEWLHEAEKNEINDPNAMCLSTVGADGMPSARIMLLKEHTANGFVFYTNLESRKGMQLAQNQKAALNFHWKSLRRQIRIEGSVGFVNNEEADAYFHTRPRPSRIGAWASQQSTPLLHRNDFEKRIHFYEEKFKNDEFFPRPPYWTGYRLTPVRIEFWIQEEFRLHRRCAYETHCPESTWVKTMLYP